MTSSTCRPSRTRRGANPRWAPFGAWAYAIPWILRLLPLIAAGIGLAPQLARAEADTLGRGDISVGLYQTIDPFNRFWYHLQDCGEGNACNRFDPLTYDVIDPPELYGVKRTIPDTIVTTTGVRAEYGILDRLTVNGEFTLPYSIHDQTSSFAIGDSRLGVRYRLLDAPFIVSLAGQLKLPGTYDPRQFGAPGGGQHDLDFKVLFGGLAARRKFFYDVGIGYRLRLPFYYQYDPVVLTPLTYSTDQDREGTPFNEGKETFLITGPADEVFLDASVGWFTSRRLLLFLNINAVNSTKGISIEDYFRVTTNSEKQDSLGRPMYTLSGETSSLFTILEEDYLRLGVGALFKAFESGTVYVNYSYVAAGSNTSAFYVIPGTRIPIGAVAVGLEYTFGTRKATTPAPAESANRADLSDAILGLRLGSPQHVSQAR